MASALFIGVFGYAYYCGYRFGCSVMERKSKARIAVLECANRSLRMLVKPTQH